MQGTINWNRGEPSQGGWYNIIYRDLIIGVDKVGLAIFKDGVWESLDGRVFVDGIIKYYGIPELITREESMYFTTQLAHKLCGIKRRMFHYWIRDGKIRGRRDSTARRWLFPLSEINRIRKERGMKALNHEEAKKLWLAEVQNGRH